MGTVQKPAGVTMFALHLGRRLRACRVAIGFDRAHLADELMIDEAALQRIEHGQEEPDLETLSCAARLFGKSLHFLITGAEFTLE